MSEIDWYFVQNNEKGKPVLGLAKKEVCVLIDCKV